MKTNFISEIGINHNGDLNIAKKIISLSSIAGCKYVKIQKRNPDKCVPEHQKNKLKNTPWGEMTYLEYKKKIELNMDQVKELNDSSIIVEGNMTIRDLNRHRDWNIPDEEANTVAGLVIHEAQSIPSEKQIFIFNGFRYEILKRKGNRITKIKIKKLSA